MRFLRNNIVPLLRVSEKRILIASPVVVLRSIFAAFDVQPYIVIPFVIELNPHTIVFFTIISDNYVFSEHSVSKVCSE